MSVFPSPEAGFYFNPIAYIESPFQEKFAIPRQPGLAPSARGRLRFVPPYDRPEALEGLEQVSHLWLLWVFHQIPAGSWRPRVRPPRLGGNSYLGVFASRSMFRPNPIGLSLVRLDAICTEPGALGLEISGLDLLDATPVLDIKPYLPYTDCLPEAWHRLAEQAPDPALEVEFSEQAQEALLAMGSDQGHDLEMLIRETLALDPRPGYRRGQLDDRNYGTKLQGCEVRWRYLSLNRLVVFEIGDTQ